MSEIESNVSKSIITEQNGIDLVAAINRFNADYLAVNTNSYDPDNTLAEVKNARCLDGNTYTTLGEALRNALNERVTKDVAINHAAAIVNLRNTKADQSDLNVEKARIDALSKAGTVEGSEVIDCRVGVDGTVYATAGDAIRSQIQDIKDTTASNKYISDTIFENFFAMQRDGKLYQVKIPKFASNPTSACEKLLDNKGLVFEPSTDTTEGQDDYANIPLFNWWHCNYIREDNTDVRVTALKGATNYKEEGNVDVGAMGMTFYWGVVDNDDHILLTISDSPHPELNLKPWVESVRADGSIAPYWCHSAYISGIGSDGLLHSQPNLPPARHQSYNNMITNYAKKGKGYQGTGGSRNTFQIIFNAIMGATKNSQTLYAGVTNYSWQYPAQDKRAEKANYITVSSAQADNIPIGCYVSIGYQSMNGDKPSTDRGYATMHKYADDVVVLSKETQVNTNVRIYVDAEPFSTEDVTIASGVTSEIYISSMHARAGETNKVIGKHNGSPVSNTDSKHPYRVQGTEYAVGGYVVASDVVMCFNADYSKDVYAAPKGMQRSSSGDTIKATYKKVGNIPAFGETVEYYSGDFSADLETGVSYPSTKGSSSSQGTGDYIYSDRSTNGVREYLIGGALWLGAHAGSLCVGCWLSLGGGGWYCLSAD